MLIAILIAADTGKAHHQTCVAERLVPSQDTTGRAPAENAKTPPQTRFHLIRPLAQDTVLQKQAYNKQRHDTGYHHEIKSLLTYLLTYLRMLPHAPS